MNNSKKKSFSVYLGMILIITMVGLTNHVMVVPMILSVAKRDAWISILMTSIPFFLWIPLIYIVMKKTKQQHIITWIKQKHNGWIAWIINSMFLFYLISIIIITLKDSITWTHSTYLPRTPKVVLGGSFMLLSFFSAKSGLRAIAITNGILLPIVVFLGFFVAIANFPNKDHSLLFPVFSTGWQPALHGMLFIGAGFLESILLVLIQHHVSSRIKLRTLYCYAAVVVILALGPTIGSITEFGPFEAAKQRYPAFEQWRLLKIGKYISHLDFLSIYQWMSGAFIITSVALFLFVDLLQIKNDQRKTITLFILSLIAVATAELPVSDVYMFDFVMNYFTPFALVFSLAMSFFIVILSLFSRKKRRQKH